MKKSSSLPIRYKFLGAMVFLLAIAISSNLYLATDLFNKDKKSYIFESQESLVSTLESQTKSEYVSLIQAMKMFNAFIDKENGNVESIKREIDLSSLNDQLFAISTFIYKSGESSQGKSEFSWVNQDLLTPYDLDKNFVGAVNNEHPVSFDLVKEKGILFRNGTINNTLPLLTLSIIVPTVKGQQRIVTCYIFQTERTNLFKASSANNAFIIDSDGFLIFHPRDQTLTTDADWSKKPIVSQVLESQANKGVKEYESKDEKEWIYSFSKSQLLGMTFISKVSKNRAFLASRILVTKTILLGALVLCLCLIFSLLFTQGLTASIMQLSDATLEIIKGNYEVQVPITSGDEIGKLGESFNKMSGEITRLLKETAENARFEKELETAQAVQGTLFPKPDTDAGKLNISGFNTPASECGGDLWGFFDTGKNVEYVYVADAMGHGVPAALVTAMAYSTCEILNRLMKETDKIYEPSEILTTFNKLLYEAVEGTISMTLFIMKIDYNANTITYSNAGHNFPYLIPESVDDDRIKKKMKFLQKVSEKTPIALSQAGYTLGMDPESEYQNKTVELRKGDKFFLFSDGIIECKSPDGKEWGTRNMLKHLMKYTDQSVKELNDSIVKDAFKFFSDQPLDDDVTAVAVEFPG